MKKIQIALFILLFLPILMPAQESGHPYAATFEKVKRTYILNEDGSKVERYYKQIKLHNQFAFNRMYGETFIVYNPDFQSLKIDQAYTIMADSTRVDLPKNALNEVLPRAATNFAAFNQLREMVVTHTALEPGATIVLEYSITSKPTGFDQLSENIQIGEQVPVKEYEIEVQVPEGASLYHRMLNVRLGPSMVAENGMKIFTWKLKGVKAKPHEIMLLPNAEIMPNLSITTFKDMHRAYDNFCSQDAFRYSRVDGAKALVDSLVVTNVDKINQILAIQNYVVNHVNYGNISLSLSHYVVESAQQVWDRNIGTSAGKAVLLSALLNQGGFNAMPVVYIFAPLYHKDMGCISLFENFGVRVILKGGERIFLSSTSMNKNSLDIMREGYVVISLDANVETLRSIGFNETEAVVKADGFFTLDNELQLLGHVDFDLENSANPYFDFLTKEDQIKRVFTNVISGAGISNVSRKELSKTAAKYRVDIAETGAVKVQEDYIFWPIPSLKSGADHLYPKSMPAAHEGRFDITPLRESYSYTFIIPDGYVLVTPPKKVERRQTFGFIDIEIYSDGQKVYVRRNLHISDQELSSMHYENFREVMLLWNDKSMKEIVLKKK